MNKNYWLQLLNAIALLSATSVIADSDKAVPIEVKSMDDYELLEKAAFDGDYQAQRNLAYTLSTGMPYNPILGCAWRMVIIESGSLKVDQSDTRNKVTYCDKLTPDELLAATKQKDVILAKLPAQK